MTPAPRIIEAWFVMLAASIMGVAAGLAIARRVVSGSRQLSLGSMVAWTALAAGFSGLIAAHPYYYEAALVLGLVATACTAIVDLGVIWLLDPWRDHPRFRGRAPRRVTIPVRVGIALIAGSFLFGPSFGPLELAVILAMGVAINAMIRIAAMSRRRGRSVAHE